MSTSTDLIPESKDDPVSDQQYRERFESIILFQYPILLELRIFVSHLTRKLVPTPASRQIKFEHQNVDSDTLKQMLIQGRDMWMLKPTFFATIGDILIARCRALAKEPVGS